MEVGSGSLIKFFDGEKQSVIPLFQRRYSWRERDWETLWRDLIAQIDPPPGRPPHFFGAIVSMPWKHGPLNVSRHLIIDGQQRLITFALMLAALRDRVEGSERGRVEDLLVNRHQSGELRPKVLPTQDDRTCFGRVIAGEQLADDSPLAKAAVFLRTRIEKLHDPAALLTVLRERAVAVSITLSESDDPYLIFESLNHKGQPLTQADLVRNLVVLSR